jgi:hypothetical protein
MATQLFCIAWRSLLTLNEGRGKFLYTEEDATKKAEELNKMFPGTIHHWVEWE